MKTFLQCAAPREANVPGQLSFTADSAIELLASEASETAPSLPKFRMVAYTGAPMRVSGWRYPVVLDLDGLAPIVFFRIRCIRHVGGASESP